LAVQLLQGRYTAGAEIKITVENEQLAFGWSVLGCWYGK
jgi:hypothetical protein